MKRHRWWPTLLGLLVLVMAVGACASPLDEAGARKAATDYYMAFDHEGDNLPADVVITDIAQATREGARVGRSPSAAGS